MKRTKIAPVVRRLLDSKTCIGNDAKQLRALLAVARAAQKVCPEDGRVCCSPGHTDLWPALRRLAKVSQP